MRSRSKGPNASRLSGASRWSWTGLVPSRSTWSPSSCRSRSNSATCSPRSGRGRAIRPCRYAYKNWTTAAPRSRRRSRRWRMWTDGWQSCVAWRTKRTARSTASRSESRWSKACGANRRRPRARTEKPGQPRRHRRTARRDRPGHARTRSSSRQPCRDAEKIVAIEGRRQLIDDVQRKADTIRHILGDVQITLDSVSEQKAMVDHVFAELARLDVRRAGSARHDASAGGRAGCGERIVENVRQIHARAADDDVRRTEIE